MNFYSTTKDNSTTKNNSTTKDNSFNRSCIIYQGGVCSEYLSNETKFSNSTGLRYVDYKLGVDKTNDAFIRFLKAANSTGGSTTCKNYLFLSLCRFGIPNCFNDKYPLKVCREDCEFVFKECKEHFSKFIGAANYIAIVDELNFEHLAIPQNCNDFLYSYDNSSCQYVFDWIDRSRPLKKKSFRIKVFFIPIIALIVLLIMIVITILLRRKCTKKKRKGEQKVSFQELNTMTSIRDHIRENAFNNNPLQELLASVEPGEIIQYPLDCVEYIRDLGEGQFGKVFQGRIHGVVKEEESTDVAVKCLKQGSSLQVLEAFNKEVKLMSALKHSNILRLLAVSTEEEPYCMIFEFMENGDLNEYLRKNKDTAMLSDSDLITICKHIASGMNHLASKKFVHRDLATRNCLVGKDLLVKIADFGMSRDIYHSDYYRVGGEALLPIRWMPPEAILYGKFTVATDIFSFGVTMWEVFTFGMQPFYGYTNEEVVEFIKKGVLLPMPDDCPQWIYEIMIKCWKHDPEERILFADILKLLKGQFIDHELPNQEDCNVLPSCHETYDSVPNRGMQECSTYDTVHSSKDVEPHFSEKNLYYNNTAIEESSDCKGIIVQDICSGNTSPQGPSYYNITKIDKALLTPHYHNLPTC
ncbi:tyrosine-protein kinase transmembrane receptor Ror isoform X2 [Hydra vulgaris]|nr:tyrosine-protein kinase transmembrane receptor Ror isoform X2 [Hydra vulgaris]